MTSKKKITDDAKDKISDSLDKASDKVDNLSDAGKITDAGASSLKSKISKTKGKLDEPKEVLHNLIKKKVMRDFVDQIVDEISEIVRDEVLIEERIKRSLYRNEKFKTTLANLCMSASIRTKK